MGEQLRRLRAMGIPYDVHAGCALFCRRRCRAGGRADPAGRGAIGGADAHLGPRLCHARGRDAWKTLPATGATLAIHLSVHVLADVVARLTPHYGADCPLAVVFRASWPDQRSDPRHPSAALKPPSARASAAHLSWWAGPLAPRILTKAAFTRAIMTAAIARSAPTPGFPNDRAPPCRSRPADLRPGLGHWQDHRDAGADCGLSRRGGCGAALQNRAGLYRPRLSRGGLGRDLRSIWTVGPWRPARIAGLAGRASGADLVIAEGSMGLFDGGGQPGETGIGASADLAELMGWPVIAVLDVSGQAQTAAAVAAGLAAYRARSAAGGVIAEQGRLAPARGAGPRGHGGGGSARSGRLAAPRLGRAARTPSGAGAGRGNCLRLQALLEEAAAFVAAHCDLAAIRAAGHERGCAARHSRPASPAPGARIALARGCGLFLCLSASSGRLAGARARRSCPLPAWRMRRRTRRPLSAGCPAAIPELHAGRLAAAHSSRPGLQRFAGTAVVHGECGGYMVLVGWAVMQRHKASDGWGFWGWKPALPSGGCIWAIAGRGFCSLARLARRRPCRGPRVSLCQHPVQPDAPLADVIDANGDAVAETGSRRQTAGGGLVSGTFFHLIAPARHTGKPVMSQAPVSLCHPAPVTRIC